MKEIILYPNEDGTVNKVLIEGDKEQAELRCWFGVKKPKESEYGIRRTS